MSNPDYNLSNGGMSKAPRKRRADHNEIEKARREHQREQLERLGTMIPETAADGRPSALQIILATQRYVCALRERVSELEAALRNAHVPFAPARFAVDLPNAPSGTISPASAYAPMNQSQGYALPRKDSPGFIAIPDHTHMLDTGAIYGLFSTAPSAAASTPAAQHRAAGAAIPLAPRRGRPPKNPPSPSPIEPWMQTLGAISPMAPATTVVHPGAAGPITFTHPFAGLQRFSFLGALPTSAPGHSGAMLNQAILAAPSPTMLSPNMSALSAQSPVMPSISGHSVPTAESRTVQAHGGTQAMLDAVSALPDAPAKAGARSSSEDSANSLPPLGIVQQAADAAASSPVPANLRVHRFSSFGIGTRRDSTILMPTSNPERFVYYKRNSGSSFSAALPALFEDDAYAAVAPGPGGAAAPVQISCAKCHRGVDNLAMIDCDRCKCWYHLRCVNIADTHVPVHWTCPECPVSSASTSASASLSASAPASAPASPRASPVPSVHGAARTSMSRVSSFVNQGGEFSDDEPDVTVPVPRQS